MKLTAKQLSALSWVHELGQGVKVNSNTAKALAARGLLEVVGSPAFEETGSVCRITKAGLAELKQRGEG